jgi:hypothetical protein
MPSRTAFGLEYTSVIPNNSTSAARASAVLGVYMPANMIQPNSLSKHSLTNIITAPGARLSNSAADSHFIAHVIAAKVQKMPDYAPCEILQDINRFHRVEVSYSQAYRAKQKAIKNLNGTPEEGYANLPEYCEKLLQANLGGSIFLETITSDIGNNFRRLFIAYKAAIDGFVHCRVLLGLDGTHLTSKYGGILLTATATDARGQLFSLIFAVVSARNDSNCEWFTNHIHFIH